MQQRSFLPENHKIETKMCIGGLDVKNFHMNIYLQFPGIFKKIFTDSELELNYIPTWDFCTLS